MRYLAAIAAITLAIPAAAQPAKEWVDPLTGHRVVQVSREPGSVNLYFHQNSYLPQGDKMVFLGPKGIMIADLKTWAVKPLVTQKGAVLLFTGHKTRNVYFASRGRDDSGKPFDVMAADADTGKVRKIATVPGGWIGSINADETLLLGRSRPRSCRCAPTGRWRAATARRIRRASTTIAPTGPTVGR